MFKCIKTPEELNTGLDLYAFNPPLITEGFISLGWKVPLQLSLIK